MEEVAELARAEGLDPRWGRKVLENQAAGRQPTTGTAV
jgi:hypothetical protein